MSPQSVQMMLAAALGFAVAGLCCSAYRLATDRLPSLSLLARGPRVSAFAGLALLIVAAPFLIIRATLLGFSCSLAGAFLLSAAMNFFAPVRRALFPVFVISQTLPLVAIAPLVVLWFGFGLLPKILLVALVTFFPMLVALVQGYESTEKEITLLLRSMGASRWRSFWLARAPSALPFFFAGLRISITYAVVGAIFAEYAGATRGLGIYILKAKNNFRPDLVLAAVAVSAALTLVLFAATGLVQRLAMPWQRLEQRRTR